MDPIANGRFFSIGHSTRSLDELVALLREHAVTCLVDVRTVPRSRHNPQFNLDSLPAGLADHDIQYRHMASLGGLRHARKDSINQGWRNASFRGYADYMQTPEFDVALQELIGISGEHAVAVMCAEAVPWRCHRSLIADALAVHGIELRHIMGPGKSQPHRLTPFAEVQGTRLTYPFALQA